MTMTTKELIQAEIEKIGEDDLPELYGVIQQFVAAKSGQQGAGILSKLRDVKIDAPPDFASNFDLYLSGEKRVGDDLH
jgi:hypothetical protein